MFGRWIEGDLQNFLSEEGIGTIAFCPLAQGLLTNKYLKGIPEDSRAA
jgi:L-glyceraldehyde 3-phosphate reductase